MADHRPRQGAVRTGRESEGAKTQALRALQGMRVVRERAQKIKGAQRAGAYRTVEGCSDSQRQGLRQGFPSVKQGGSGAEKARKRNGIE